MLRVLILFMQFSILSVNLSYADNAKAGLFATNYGPLQIFNSSKSRIVGTYFYKGRPAHVYAKRKQQNSHIIYKGIWIQGVSEYRCRKSIYGSLYWGRVNFIFIENKIYGLWSYCNQRLTRKSGQIWKGRLRKAYLHQVKEIPQKPKSTNDRSEPLPADQDPRVLDDLQSNDNPNEDTIAENFGNPLGKN